MKLIIDIDDKVYEFIKNLNYVILARGNGKTISMHIMRAIKQGIPYKERSQGEWKFKKFDEKTGIPNSYWCPFCGMVKAQVYDNFCGNCGADMRKGGTKE